MEQDYGDEHIYENVISVTRYKYNKILNGIFNSLTPKRDKLSSPSSSPSIHRSIDDEMGSCEFYENSYTSCEDDNIYENLEFFDAYDDDNFLHNDCALDEWLRNLSHDIDDYETDNYIFIKSIPSVLQAQCASSIHPNISKSEITLNFLKSLWREDRIGMMSFLLETFSNLLKLQQPQHAATVSAIEENKTSAKKRKKSSSSRRKIYQQKLEHVILSSSLNSLMITYNKSLKFYFALSQRSKTFSSRLSANDVSVVEVLVTIRRNFQLKFNSKSERREFFALLKLILTHKLNEIDQLNSSVVELRGNCENIYQPIWTCQSLTSEKRSAMVISENIYAQLMTNESPTDDHEWEVDDEFSFMTSTMIGDKSDESFSAMSSAYRTVWILYNNENPNLNKIIYDQDLFTESLHSTTSEFNSQLDSPTSENKLIIKSENIEISKKMLSTVEHWKNELRMPCNMEDEEDFLVSDSILSLNYYQSNESINNNSNVSLESDTLSKSVYDDATSTSFHFGSTEVNWKNTQFNKSLDSFKSASNLDENDSLPTDSPRKVRKFDKMLSKLKLNSFSQTVNISDNSLNESTKSDDELERHRIFGCNLEMVEKDGYYKDIPKFVVECVRYLEIESNLRTSGIYRISGNKTVMDAIKKKMNDKKPPKKESSKYSCLQDQDVHTLTGLLKTFFRELNPPLMSKEVFASCTSEKLSASQMREKLKEMPALNYALLKYLFKHFKSVEQYAKENSMTSGNIAICCGIGLFSGGDDINPFDNDIGKCNTLCRFLIDEFKEIFKDDVREY